MSSSSGQGSMSQQPGMGTGTPITDSSQNLRYDLVSVLYHACESNATIQQYIQDAKQQGNNDAFKLFQMVAQQDQQRAEQAQQLLFQLSSSTGGARH
ncbi:MAG TPA: hypothetical protein VFY89_06735 [Ktedonobacterales bacterium]|nr:hypothetical protein [Ktedonobacterales bacterium]